MGIVQAIWRRVGSGVRVSFASEFNQSTSRFLLFFWDYWWSDESVLKVFLCLLYQVDPIALFPWLRFE